MGGVIDGMPSGIAIDMEEIQRMVDRRRPGRGAASTTRQESDRVEVLSGIFEGKTLGTPIGFIIRNEDACEADYDLLRYAFRPSHADYTYHMKYGIRDHRGGGRASGRETVSRVVAGAFARLALLEKSITIKAYVSQVGNVSLKRHYKDLDLSQADKNEFCCPDAHVAQQMADAVSAAREAGDTLGGRVTCVVSGLIAGLGEPVFGKLDAELAAAMMSIPAAKAVAVGDGVHMAESMGSQVIDRFVVGEYGCIGLAENHAGGILGGISTGDDICVDVYFKPVATLMRPVETLDVNARPVTLPPRGRHDVCVAPRAVPVVESMAAMTVLDSLLLSLGTF